MSFYRTAQTAFVWLFVASGVFAQVSSAPSLSSTALQTFMGPIQAKSIGNVPQVDQYLGPSVGAKIDSACADLTNAYGMAAIPYSTGPGFSAQIPGNCALLDMRQLNQPDANGFESNNAYSGGVLFRQRLMEPLGASYAHENVLNSFADIVTGGHSENYGSKTTIGTASIRTHAGSIGQMYGLQVQTYTSGAMDTVGGFFKSVCGGAYYALGDEGCQAFRAEAAQDSTVFTGVLNSITALGNGILKLAFASQANGFAVGEQRWILDVTGNNVDTVGVVAGITGSGNGVTVTGSGTNWSTWNAASCSAGQAFFSIDGVSALNGLPYVVPVNAILSNTSLTLNYQLPQYSNNATWAANAQNGPYHLYCGETVQTTDLNANGQMLNAITTCVVPQTNAAPQSSAGTPTSPGACTAAAGPLAGPFTPGDTLVVYPAYNTIPSNRIDVSMVWQQFLGHALELNNTSPNGYRGAAALYTSGPWQYTFYVTSASNGSGIGNLNVGMATGVPVWKFNNNNNLATSTPLWQIINHDGSVSNAETWDFSNKQLSFLNSIRITAGAFSGLPACSGLEGSQASVTDSTTATYGATITGGGSTHVHAYCNGTNWIVN